MWDSVKKVFMVIVAVIQGVFLVACLALIIYFLFGWLFPYRAVIWLVLSFGSFILVYWGPYLIGVKLIGAKYKYHVLVVSAVLVSIVLIPLCEAGLVGHLFFYLGRFLGVEGIARMKFFAPQ